MQEMGNDGAGARSIEHPVRAGKIQFQCPIIGAVERKSKAIHERLKRYNRKQTGYFSALNIAEIASITI